jgi:hypothetical protein
MPRHTLMERSMVVKNSIEKKGRKKEKGSRWVRGKGERRKKKRKSVRMKEEKGKEG